MKSMSRKPIFTSLVLLAYSLVFGALSVHADDEKGWWGRVVPIADNAHPNLYYNQGEINELRVMVLVNRTPWHLYNLYLNSIRDIMAVVAHPGAHYTNSKAAVSYMMEPTSAKADAIKASLISYMFTFPEGLGSWYDQAYGFSGLSLAWMFDLLQAYNPEKLSSTERSDVKAWFAKSAERLKFDTRTPYEKTDGSIAAPKTREGKTMNEFPNWFSRYMGPSLACALVSGDQAAVDYWADSGWPHTLFTTPSNIGSMGLSSSVNRYDLVMYLLSTYASGANTDTYEREGYDLLNRTWYTTSYDASPRNQMDNGSYHFAQQIGVMVAAEMAYHNGMTGVFTITDAGTEPALLRTYQRAIRSKTEVDLRPTSLTGRPNIGYYPMIWMGYRRYSDPLLDGAVSSLDMSLIGPEFPNEVYVFFGYPRRVVWPPTGTTSSLPTPR
jgi:hypothetical protein